MLTEKQVKWLEHLSDEKKVTIVPHDPRVKQFFDAQKRNLLSWLGEDTLVLHKGASAWGISGKGDVDIYVPVAELKFEEMFEKMKEHLGEPGSYYAQERVRWTQFTDGFEVEIFLVNNEAGFWKNSLIFWEYIENSPETMEEYRKIKEEAGGLSVREYYRIKLEFYNKITDLAKKKSEGVV